MSLKPIGKLLLGAAAAYGLYGLVTDQTTWPTIVGVVTGFAIGETCERLGVYGPRDP